MKRHDTKTKLKALGKLKGNDGNVRKTAREMDIPEQTLRNWRDGKGISEIEDMSVSQWKEEMKPILQGLVWKAFKHVKANLEDIMGEASNPQQVMTSLGIAMDKLLKLEDESDTTRDRTEQIEKEVAKLIERVRNGEATEN